RRVISPRPEDAGVRRVEGGGRPLRRDVEQRARGTDPRLLLLAGPRAHRDDVVVRRRHAVDAAGARARARAQARERRVRRARRPLPARRARRRRRPARADRRGARERPERDPHPALMRTLLCFGDSNTWGYDPESGTETRRFPRDVRWPGRLARALGNDWEV